MQIKDDQHALPPAPLTIHELMSAARISKATAYRWVRSKKILSVRIGKRILIPRNAISELLTP